MTAALALCIVAGTPGSARADDPVNLGSAATFSVLAGTSVVNQNDTTTVVGNLGVSPGSAVVGFPPGIVRNGAVHANDALATSARAAIVAANNDISARGPATTVAAELGGTTKGPGIYTTASGAFTITGVLTLDAQRDPNAIFIFKATSLTAAQSSTVTLIRGAQINNVFFQISDTADLGVWTTFQGNVLAQNTIQIAPGAFVYGRFFSLNQYVIMQDDSTSRGVYVSLPDNPPTTTTLASAPNPSQQNQQVTFVATVNAVSGDVGPQGEVVFKNGGTIIGSSLIDSNQTATFTTSSLAPGQHQITAVYLGGDTYHNEDVIRFAPSTSNLVTQVVSASLWSPAATPAVASHIDPLAVTLGVKFRAQGGGTITGLRFYKGSSNTGTHTGALWSSGGQLLASAVFSDETPSGWQQVNFTTPVTISGGTIYIASYHTTSGYYSVTRPYFTTDYVNNPLTAPASGAVGGNGVYAYGASNTFPTSTYVSTNYWVDVVFVPGGTLSLSTSAPADSTVKIKTAPQV